MTDPRALALAKARQQRAHNADSITAHWDSLQPSEQRLLLAEAGAWLRAAVAAGIAPPAVVDDCPGCANFPSGGYRPAE